MLLVAAADHVGVAGVELDEPGEPPRPMAGNQRRTRPSERVQHNPTRRGGVVDGSGDQDLEARLSMIGERFLSHVMSEWAVRMFQLVVSEAHRTPELARMFYEAGPAVGVARLTDMLEEARARGEIEAEDCGVAAQQFMSLCRGHLHFRYSLNLIERPSEAMIKATIDEAVRTFMARYGRPGAGAGTNPR